MTMQSRKRTLSSEVSLIVSCLAGVPRDLVGTAGAVNVI